MTKSLILLVLLATPAYADSSTITTLIPHLIQVESNGNDAAVGDRGKAIGALQIWGVVVEDVNRVYGTSFKHSDARTRHLACSVCHLYLTYWGRHYQKITGKVPSIEVYARMWNGGPRGYSKQATIAYWGKVKRLL